MATVGRRLLSAIVYGKDVKEYLKLNLEPDLFRDSEVELYEAINEHIMKYGKIPAESTLKDKGLSETLTEAPEPAAFYLEGVEARYLRTGLKNLVIKANNHLVDENETEAYDELMQDIAKLHKKRNRNKLFDFREALKLVWGEYAKQKTMGDDYSLKFGWSKIDNMTGGMKGGDFITFVGRPASGKTFKLLYIAYRSWKKGRVPLFVSMEMNTTIIVQRFAAMHGKKNLTNLLKGQMSTSQANELQKSLKQAGTADNPMWIVDGNLTSTVDDIIMLCRQLGVTDVYVDGAYLMQHPDKKLNKWDRQSANAELLKQRVAQDLDIPVVASYQLSKGKKGDKKSKDDKTGLDDIYGSDAIAQLSTIVMALFEDDSIETQISRKVTILKGRNGEQGEFRIRWDFNKMDFRQVVDKKEKNITEDDYVDDDEDELPYTN